MFSIASIFHFFVFITYFIEYVYYVLLTCALDTLINYLLYT